MNQIINDEVVYAIEGNAQRKMLHSYHSKPRPRDDFKKAGKRDIKGLPRKAMSCVDVDSGESNYTIGFEVEKNSISRHIMREYALFCGFERDGSCGVEAVTNPIPLLPPSMWRTKVFDLMYQARKVIDDTHSPSNDSCGGHITISVKGMTGQQLLKAMRPYAGLLLAIYRHRLKNGYCGNDPTLRGSDGYHLGYHSGRYRVALVKDDLLEWRLPSRFTNVKLMMARYELMYELVHTSVTECGDDKSFKAFLKRVRPIVDRLYEGNKELVDKVYGLAPKFRAFIQDMPTNSEHLENHPEVKGFLMRGLI